MTGFDMAVGKGDAYAGGYTAASGTSTIAVHNPSAVAAGTSPSSASRLARSAAPLRRDWACGWPEDAEAGEVRDVRVTIRVSVSRDGAAEAVDVVGDAAPMFADAARRCASAELYRAALDNAGAAVVGVTQPFVVHFLR
jgi:hypothetical protein